MLSMATHDRRFARQEAQPHIRLQHELQSAREGLPPGWCARQSERSCVKCQTSLAECPCAVPERLYYEYVPSVEGFRSSSAHAANMRPEFQRMRTQVRRPLPIGAMGEYKMEMTYRMMYKTEIFTPTPPPPPPPPPPPLYRGVPDKADAAIAIAAAAPPQWSRVPRPLVPLPMVELAEMSGGSTDEAAQLCPYFGSESGCFASFRGAEPHSCPYRHADPNSVPLCGAAEGVRGAGKRCLRMAACNRRHRVWSGWQDAQCFYLRIGPYDHGTAGLGGGYVGPGEGGAPAAGANDSGAGGDGETEETSAFLQLCAPSAPYAEHRYTVERSRQMFERVCGRAPLPSHGGVDGWRRATEPVLPSRGEWRRPAASTWRWES